MTGNCSPWGHLIACRVPGWVRFWLTCSRASRFKFCVHSDIDLGKLSDAEKDDLIRALLPLAGQLETALARIAVLEKRLAH